MSTTVIHTTKKLEKQIQKFIRTGEPDRPSPLGKWNATVFFFHRKKCWLVTNKRTQYHLFLPGITAAKFKDIDRIFKDTFYAQAVSDGLVLTREKVDELIGTLEFRPTDNDRSMTGFQNQRLFEAEWRLMDFPDLDQVPMRALNHAMNTVPIHLGPSRKLNDYTRAVTEMKKLLERVG